MSKLIYVVEDDSSIRALIKIALVSFSYAPVLFDNAEDALEKIASSPPDLAIFDIMLPQMSGLEALAILRSSEKTAKLPIMLLTAKTTELDKVTGLDNGADDYITKPFSVMELGARIRAIFRRAEAEEQIAPAQNEFAFSDISVNLGARELKRGGELVPLTFKEFEVLSVLITERDRVVPREELLLKAWGEDFLGESRAIDMHIRALRQKLGDDADHPRYIKTLRGAGYRFIGEAK